MATIKKMNSGKTSFTVLHSHVLKNLSESFVPDFIHNLSNLPDPESLFDPD